MIWTAFHVPDALSVAFQVLYFATAIGVILVVVLENRNPLKTISWVIILLLLPIIGLVFYFFFGQNTRKLIIVSRRTYRRIMRRPIKYLLPQIRQIIPEEVESLVTLNYRNAHAPVLTCSDIEIFTDGGNMYEALKRAIRSAKDHIHLQFYIFSDDEVGREFRDLLIFKAREGVKIRLLYDDVGNWQVKNSFYREMTKVGIEVSCFLRVAFPLLTSKVNYRNHRKLVIIDGEVGFIGGMNIADRYRIGLPWGGWRDTHLSFKGAGVQGLQSSFLIDWYTATKMLLSEKKYFPPYSISSSSSLIQVVSGGPIGHWPSLLQATVLIISRAKRYLYIQTPYLLPTEGINLALQSAARSGVDVRVMIPYRCDAFMPGLASLSYVGALLRAGIKVYRYRPGFLHSKLIVCDDFVSVVGSANMDFRSFEHNFETNAYLYGKEIALRLKHVFLEDEFFCTQLTYKSW
ncbi:MAG: cardiolipin synthase, partial [Bacteroidales bacterium]|nr:cardiolipin synthase [Bacteroidales bacterium]